MARRIAKVRLSAAVSIAIAVASAAGTAIAAERLAGPVSATVERVIDGDTLVVSARIWLGLTMTTHVRLRGIDTPETHQPKCASEKAMGLQATAKLTELAGSDVVLADIENDKYGERVDAAVTTPTGLDVAAAMVASGLARPYDGGTRGDWCATGSIQ
jgi:endonuclease YncB( thermonuclease family)